MPTVSDIFALCDRHGVRIWREGDRLRFKAVCGGLPPTVSDVLATNRDAILEKLPDGFGWYRGGAIRNKTPDFRTGCRFMAEQLGWPAVQVWVSDREAVSLPADRKSWLAFIERQSEEVVASAALALEPLWLNRKRGAA